ncbi:MAG: type II toxin-antitoxin system VapC family toxin [Actinomycetota bacterium]|nr:type II toxin-antitoxin system VapC family toxin [Actinomycetota bacterium]
MIVVDASVIVASLISGGGAGARARERLRLDPDLHVPHLLDVEVVAALRRRVRLGQTDIPLAAQAVSDLNDLAALRWDHAPLLGRVWQLRENVTPYDAVYVALAEALSTPLVTSDVRLSRSPGIGCQVEVLLD